MFKPTRVNLSVLSKRTKRVKVQLLRDFPRFHLWKGQVAQVKPSVMTNYLYPFNGAQYILVDSDIRPKLLSQYEERMTSMKVASEVPQDQEVKSFKGEEAKTAKQEDTDDTETKKKRPTFLGTDITTKDIKIPGLNL